MLEKKGLYNIHSFKYVPYFELKKGTDLLRDKRESEQTLQFDTHLELQGFVF